MLQQLIRLSLRAPRAVAVLFLGLIAAGLVLVPGLPVDVFPDLSAPTVTILTEATGWAPEEVELLVTLPLESAVNGAAGVRRVRSVSAAGISVVWVEFAWGEDVYRARQIVTERIATAELPAGVARPQLGPVSSIMGEITFLALTSGPDGPDARTLRRFGEVTVRRALLAVPGVAQVVPIGGELREIQVEVEPSTLAARQLPLSRLVDALGQASASPAAGFHVDSGQEHLVRGATRARTPGDFAAAVVRAGDDGPLTVGDVARVAEGNEPKRGTAAYNARPAVILSVQKQPGANTLALTRTLDARLAELERSFPPGIRLERENFRQADFIQVAIRNVSKALAEGALLVVLVLVLFLGDGRSTLISALALPTSLIAGVLAFSAFGAAIDTMTLGGLTIAIGVLVDDAIIDVENVLRRLRENQRRPESERRPALETIFLASSEVRGAILFATLVIAVVFAPLFFLPGIEGLLLRPLGLAYLTALVASMFVSLTLTPALCLLLLPGSRALEKGEPRLLRLLQRRYTGSLDKALRRPWPILALSALLLVGAVALLPWLGRSFLPAFNEGSLTVGIVAPPGTSLADSDALGLAVEEALLDFPEVVSTSRRTGRAERDEHVQGANASEMEVVLRPGRAKGELLAEMRRAVATIPGVVVSFGQPISHRIDHMLSGSKSNLAIKIKGPELATLRTLARQVESALQASPDLVDLSNQEQALVPQLALTPDRAALARHGLTAQDAAQSLEALFQGTKAAELVEDGLSSRVVVRYPERLRDDRDRLADLPMATPAGDIVPLSAVARADFDLGPGLVRRENVERVALLSANVAGSDLAGTVARALAVIAEQVRVPAGYRIEFGGQFEEANQSARRFGWLALAVLLAVWGILWLAFRDHRQVAIVLVNLPLALVGGVAALLLTSATLSIASMVGFVTLFGIATRNGVLLVSHYRHLIEEGAPLHEAVREGSRERLAPVLMTALTAALALIPLALAGDQPGNEIQSPMAVVILGGLLTSTFLNLLVVPVLFRRFGA
ncbi:MAG: efflux RND transporter permease subunit [Thermoanaerobaculia bacterium]